MYGGACLNAWRQPGASRTRSQSTAPARVDRSAAGAKRGETEQAIDRSRGGRTSKIHTVASTEGRPIAFVLTPGNVADISLVACLLDGIAPSRRLLPTTSMMPTTLSNPWRRKEKRLSPRPTGPVVYPYLLNHRAYRSRNVIERMFGRLKDWQRMVTCYNRLAMNFLSAVALVPTAYF